jgi:hypothetical protein
MQVVLKSVRHANNEVEVEVMYIEANISFIERKTFPGTATLADLETAVKATAGSIYQAMATANSFMIYINAAFYYDPVADTLTPV